MNEAIAQIIENTRQSLESVTGAKILSIKFKATYNPDVIEKLKNAVCRAYEITMSDLHRVSMEQEFVRPKQMFYYIAIEQLKMKVVDAGDVFEQHHTTVIHGKEKVKGLLKVEDPETHDKLELINTYLNEKD